jgi:hypothetical protein
MTEPSPVTTSSEPLELETLVDAFETAQVRDGQARVDDFLPDEYHPHYGEIVLELLCVDLEYGWQRGSPQELDEYRAAFPHILTDPRNLKALAFEEYRQRCQAGVRVEPKEYNRRYGIAIGDWPAGPNVDETARVDDKSVATLDVTLERLGDDTDRLTNAVRDFPTIGSRFLQFKLLEELGRGSFARVYLARQDELAGRRVVLKVSPDFSWEAHRLAQLQRTNIVPNPLGPSRGRASGRLYALFRTNHAVRRDPPWKTTRRCADDGA